HTHTNTHTHTHVCTHYKNSPSSLTCLQLLWVLLCLVFGFENTTMDQTRSVPSSYLAWSIFNTLCCCLPLGVVAIIFSTRVNNAVASGDLTTAESASRTAKIVNIVALVIGLIFIITVVSINVKNQKH
ncbi:hypothetical protein ANANG_G00154650, partial [Anguilla anguilla]